MVLKPVIQIQFIKEKKLKDYREFLEVPSVEHRLDTQDNKESVWFLCLIFIPSVSSSYRLRISPLVNHRLNLYTTALDPLVSGDPVIPSPLTASR